MENDVPIHGRGTQFNPTGRFDSRSTIPNPDGQALPPPDKDDIPDRNVPLTQIISDQARRILASNDSLDVPFAYSINPYRGCEHGCVYCYARPTHEYLGYSAGLDFETKILVKHDAPLLLRAELSSPRWSPQVIACSGVTDCYQPIERKFELTRRCLEVLLDFRNPVGIVTKNFMVTRDLDILKQLASFQCIRVFVSVTTLDSDTSSVMEPRTSVPRKRLEAIRILAEAGIPVGVIVAPVVPAITDHEMPTILKAAAAAGATEASYIPLRLPYGLKELFSNWLDDHFPDRKQKVLNRIRDLRGGKLNDAEAFSRMRGEGEWAEQFAQMFRVHTQRLGLAERHQEHFSTAHFRIPPAPGDQLGLFDQ